MSTRSSFRPVDTKLFFSRGDSADPRLGDLVKALPKMAAPQSLFDAVIEVQKTTAHQRTFVIAGYPDDEGIRINGGRPGAALGPTEIRRSLYKMTPSLLEDRAPSAILDLGDLQFEDEDGVLSEGILARHSEVTAYASAALDAGVSWIGLGGGHDYGFADAAAFCEWAKKSGLKPLVINFDAHLDVRPFTNQASSGTPFFRMLEAYPDVDFAEIGIQTQCNSRNHLEWARARGARVLTQEEVEASNEPLVTNVVRLLGDWLLKRRPLFISIDIDGFSSAVAPGCSQSWATGFMPSEFFPVLNLLSRRMDVRMVGIYEVSPPLDSDSRTSKLGAQIIHRVIS